VTSGGSVDRDAPLRLFLALALPDDAMEQLSRWGKRTITRGRLTPAADLHVTLAFLGAVPAGEAPGIVDVLRAACASSVVGPLELRAWRETDRVGMLVLDDPTGGATRLHADLRRRLAERGLRGSSTERWLPHLTVVRHDRRPGLSPVLPADRTFVPSDAAAYVSHLHRHGARYEALARVPLDTIPRRMRHEP
jgi:RNA 2',3'-cyclic 3'-phosphodiesterase